MSEIHLYCSILGSLLPPAEAAVSSPHTGSPLCGSSGAGVPPKATARAGRSAKENHPAAQTGDRHY